MTGLLSHRVEGWLFELLDLDDQLVGPLDRVAADQGQLDFSVAAEPRGSGSCTVRGQDVDWLRHRVRVSYLHDGADPTPKITALPAAPVERHTDDGVTVDVELYDKTLVLIEDRFPGSYGLPAGTLIVDAVGEVIASTGETSMVLTESAATLATPMVWGPDATKLQIVNDLLDAAGYFSVWCDGLGRFRADPYVEVGARGVAWTFRDDATGLYLPEFDRDRDTFAVPNSYTCVARTDDESTPPAVAVAEDVDPASPFSFPSRGRWITRTDVDVEAADEATLALIARRRLAEAQQVAETFQVTHPVLPIGLNDVVEFTNTRVGTVRAVVQKQTFRLSVGGLVTSTLRRVL